MTVSYSYACSDYPGLEGCPGAFRAASRNELWRLIEVHASLAHGEDPAAWSPEDRAEVDRLITVENGPGTGTQGRSR